MRTKMYGRWITAGLTCALLVGCGPDEDGDGTQDTGTQQDTTTKSDTGMLDDGGPGDTATNMDTELDDGGPGDTATDMDTELDDGGGNVAIETSGRWVSNFGMTYEVDSEAWGDNEVVEFDNEDNVAILHIPEDAMHNADTYVRYTWTDPADGEFFYCQTTAMGKDTVEAARNADVSADPSNPLDGGCNEMSDFPWTLMNRPFEVQGTFSTPGGDSVEITETQWGNEALKDWNNDADWVVTQTPMDADENANKYNAVQYVEPDSDGNVFVCPVADGLDSLKAARDTDKSADASDPENGGCDGEAWMKYTEGS